MEQDIRWKQRFQNYKKALSQLRELVVKDDLNKWEEQALIKSFEYTYELAWNLLKDYFEDQAETRIHGSRDAFRLGFNRGLLKDGEGWMKMIESRAITVHTYNEAAAGDVVEKVNDWYFDLFVDLEDTFEAIADNKFL